MDITGMTEDEVKKAFTYGQGPIPHDWDVSHSMAQYDYSTTKIKGDINSISISNEILNWFEKANRNPNNMDGVTNLFFISALIEHEGVHWGNQVKGPSENMNNFINNFGGEHGNAFTYRLFMKYFPRVEAIAGSLGIGDLIDGFPYNLKEYVRRHYETLSNMFKP